MWYTIGMLHMAFYFEKWPASLWPFPCLTSCLARTALCSLTWLPSKTESVRILRRAVWNRMHRGCVTARTQRRRACLNWNFGVGLSLACSLPVCHNDGWLEGSGHHCWTNYQHGAITTGWSLNLNCSHDLLASIMSLPSACYQRSIQKQNGWDASCGHVVWKHTYYACWGWCLTANHCEQSIMSSGLFVFECVSHHSNSVVVVMGCHGNRKALHLQQDHKGFV